MKTFRVSDADQATLKEHLDSVNKEFTQLKAQGLTLDLTRGKPGSEQLALSESMDGILKGQYLIGSTDTRNYGGLDGIFELKTLLAPGMGVDANDIIIGGNASLTMMYQAILFAYLYGLDDDGNAWKDLKNPQFICPVPGYDRHFAICEAFGIDMIPVAMDENGPDMDAVEALIKADNNTIIGMWNVPRFSNPTGIVYSDEVTERIAKLGNLAHPGFRVFWDNAYAVHAFEDSAPSLASISQFAKRHGTEDNLLQFSSTSKITFAGAGVACMAASKTNRKHYLHHLSASSIGPDKINQLRHLTFFGGEAGLSAHMKKHAALLKPRFNAVLDNLNRHFSGSDALNWTIPKGGYFVSVNTRFGVAQRVVELAHACGVKLTPAGATFPYNKDPNDTNIRIAPSFPSVEDIKAAMAVFTVCVKKATLENALA